jgi:hypothetical protein
MLQPSGDRDVVCMRPCWLRRFPKEHPITERPRLRAIDVFLFYLHNICPIGPPLGAMKMNSKTGFHWSWQLKSLRNLLSRRSKETLSSSVSTLSTGSLPFPRIRHPSSLAMRWKLCIWFTSSGLDPMLDKTHVTLMLNCVSFFFSLLGLWCRTASCIPVHILMETAQLLSSSRIPAVNNQRSFNCFSWVWSA